MPIQTDILKKADKIPLWKKLASGKTSSFVQVWIISQPIP